MTRAELIQKIETQIERLDAHDELTASSLRWDFDAMQTGMGMNSLKGYLGVVESMLEPYEGVQA
jgi:hypothetical protein